MKKVWPRSLASKAALCIAAKIILSLAILAHATLIQSVVTSPPQQSTIGGALNVNSTLSGADKGFSKASSSVTAAGTSCSSPVTFLASAGTANNAITAGDIIYDVQLNTTSSTPASACYKVTLSITPNGGSQTSYSVYIANGSVNVAGEIIDCKFDIGSLLPSSPFSFRLTVS